MNIASRLDEVLPLLAAEKTEWHEPITIIEVVEPMQLLELALNRAIRRYLLARLSDTIALVDPGQEVAAIKAVRNEGHIPKIVQGVKA